MASELHGDPEPGYIPFNKQQNIITTSNQYGYCNCILISHAMKQTNCEYYEKHKII